MHHKTNATAKQLRTQSCKAPVRRSNNTGIGSPFNAILKLQRTVGNRAVTQLMEFHSRGKKEEKAKAFGGLSHIGAQGIRQTESAMESVRRCGNKLHVREPADVARHAPPHRRLIVQRQNTPILQPQGIAGPCDRTHAQAITSAEAQAGTWRRRALAWFETHLQNIRRRVPAVAGRYGRVGSTILRELRLLNRHFGIAGIVRNRRGLYPQSPDERLDARGFEILANVSSEVRRRYRDVDIQGLNFDCQGGPPPHNEGADWVGSAVPGSGEFRIYTTAFDAQQPQGQIGTVLHEAFHASFPDFDHDTYSHRPGYPGASPMTNADSYANFASIVATGTAFRVIRLPELRITGSPEGG